MNLTQNEALFLSDVISIYAPPPPEIVLDESPPYPSMILKLARAVLDTSQPGSETPVDFTYLELMLVWEHTKHTVVFGSERVGWNLRKKAAKELINQSEPILDERIWKFEVDTHDNPEPYTGNPEDRTTDDTDKAIPA